MSEFLGSRISLISKSDIRYVGTLHEINSDESTVSLENVRSFGTEGRRGRPEEEIAPSDQVYEYIVFRGSDVKDLRIEEHPAIKENKPPVMPDDPAIVGLVLERKDQTKTLLLELPPGPPAFHHTNILQTSSTVVLRLRALGDEVDPALWLDQVLAMRHSLRDLHPQAGTLLQAKASRLDPVRAAPELPSTQEPKPPTGPGADKSKDPKSHAQAARQPSNAPAPPVESKPSVEEVKAVATTLASNGAAKATDASKAIPTGPKANRIQPVLPLTGPASKPFQPPFAAEKASQPVPQSAGAGPSSVQDATSAARAAVALAMAQLSNTGGNAMDNLTTKVQEMRVNAIRGGSANRGRGRGGRPAKVEVPDADFDFAQSNAKFNKEDVGKEAVGGSPSNENPVAPATEGSETQDGSAPVAYNKSTSFFDNISSEAKERAENNGQKPGGREWRGEEQRRNIETFGQGSVDGGYRNYRGRGRGRGTRGGGRGYSRGGRGGPRPQYQPTAAGQ
ncbi:Scd6-like Sm domain-containing protein [Trichoderma velutinum]